MKKPLPPRASLQDGIDALKAMPDGSIIQGPANAFDDASSVDPQMLERASREAFDAALALVPDVEPLEEDRLP
jgi:hypothetical protein